MIRHGDSKSLPFQKAPHPLLLDILKPKGMHIKRNSQPLPASLSPLTETLMKLALESFVETQQSNLQAISIFAETFWVVSERLTQLNIEVTRSAVEKCAELTMECINAQLRLEMALAPSALLALTLNRPGFCRGSVA